MISHRHKCLFVHVPKTGGTSIEHAFLADLGLPLEQRAALMLGPNSTGKGPRRLSHFTASEFLKYGCIGEDEFESYFKFGFVRDPWDRVVSTYKYFRIGGEFKRFVCDVLPNSLMKSTYYGYFVRPQFEYLYDHKGDCMVDYVGRFERLAEDFEVVRAKVGLAAELPHKNQHASSAIPFMSRLRQAVLGIHARNLAHVVGALSEKEVRPSSREYFDSESAAAIGEMYAADVKTFGYAFDRPLSGLAEEPQHRKRRA